MSNVNIMSMYMPMPVPMPNANALCPLPWVAILEFCFVQTCFHFSVRFQYFPYKIVFLLSSVVELELKLELEQAMA